MKRLAQIAYSDLPAVHQEQYTYGAFVQSLNDLHHQLLARGVTTVENALHEGEAYLLAKQLHRGHMSSQQITVDPSEDYSKQLLSNHVATTATSSSMGVEVTRMTEMVEKLVAVLARSKYSGPRPKTLTVADEAPRPPALCWECGDCGHLRSECPRKKQQLNFHGPRMSPPPAGRE